MAASVFCRKGLILILFSLISAAALERRFSELKRCADEECSMLLCRGKAVSDFSGPDCRFLSFKKSETIYVYYKLSGRRTDMWAGSVGSHFGYFPKDFLAVNHIYTEKELESPAEETDFVCFDTGFDGFDNYDIDSLLGTSMPLSMGDINLNNGTSDQRKTSLVTKEGKELSGEVKASENLDDNNDDAQDLDVVPGDKSAPLPKQEIMTESPKVEADIEQIEQSTTEDDVLENYDLEEKEAKDESTNPELKSLPGDHTTALEKRPVPVSDGKPIPRLETTLGSTFDAVTTDDEDTWKVTANDNGNDLDSKLVSVSLSATEDDVLKNDDLEEKEAKDESTNPELKSLPGDDTIALEKRPVPVSEGRPIPQLKTTLGTTFDAVTTDDEDTWKVTPYVEEESEELADDHEDSSDTEKGIPLLAADAPESEHPAKEDSPTMVHHDDDHNHDQVQQTSEKNVWTSLGDKVFALVTGGETTADISSSEEDEEEEDEDEEENAPKPAPNIEKAKEDEIKLLSAELKGSDDLVTSNLANTMEIETNNDSEQLLEEDDDVEEEEVAEHENEQDETALPTDEQQAFHKNIEESTTAENPLSTGHDSDKPKPHKPQSETTKEEEEGEAEVEIEMKEVKADVDKQDNNTSKHHLEDLGTDLEDENSEEDIVDAEEDTEDIVVAEKDTEDIVVAEKDTEDIVVAEEDTEDVVAEEDTEDVVAEEDTEDVVAEEGTEEEIVVAEEDTEEDIVVAEEETKETEVDHKEEDQSDQYQEHKAIDLEKHKHGHIHPELTEEAGFPTEEIEVDKGSQKEELLEDENAISSTGSHPSRAEDAEPLLESSLPVQPTSEPEYSDDVLRLTLLRNHFSEQYMERFHSTLGLKNLFRVEAMFSDLDLELQATRRSHTGTLDDIEKALEAISEASENPILDEIEKMLDGRDLKSDDSQQKDTSLFDEESQILDDFQELAFSLRQKYSVASDSTLLATDAASHLDQDKRLPNLEESETLSHTKETHDDNHTVAKEDDSLMAPEVEERLAEKEDEKAKVHRGADIAVKEDRGHFNKNKDNQPSFDPAEEMQKVPQTILEKSFDMGIGVEMEHSSSGSGDSIEPVPDFYEEEELGFMSKGFLYASCVLDLVKTKIGEWVILVISRLPEEWKPGESLYGFPWQAVVITALVGLFSFMLFFWKTVLAVKKREYLVDENGLNDRIKTLKKEKDDAISKISDLQKHTEELKEKQKMSEVTNCSAMQRNQELEDIVLQAKTRNDQIAGERNKYARLLEEERANSLKNESRIEKLEKSNGKVQLSRKKTQEALAKITILLDEAKIREEARTVQHKCLERDHTALKEENKTLKVTIKGWEDKHKEMSEQIKVYQKSQKELEDSVVLKDHNVEVLSDLLADLDACDLQKCDKVLPNGEVAIDKKTSIKNRIKQMMDVSRIQTTLTVVEEERDRFMTKLLKEEKARKTMEEQHQELEHSIGALKGEKSHIENQYKILQQKNEIMTEMYQQKENALQQRLTKEELDRRSKESMLSEVGGKAVEAEEQVRVLRQRISEMEEQMKKTEGVYKEQIKEQENKTHSNWVNARNAERALNQEKLETSKLREKLTVLSSQLNERRAPLFRPNSGQNTGPRQGDSYGPSPVSGGAPSPPPMMEGPRRPPSAPVGRKIDPYGPRPPSDPHGRYLDNKLTSGIDMLAPRTSSPANMDTSTPPIDSDTQAEAYTEIPETGPGSFIASPIRDSPASGPQGPPVALGPHDPLLPPGPHGRFPPPGPHRSVRPLGPHYHPGAGPGHHIPPHGPPLPANGHPGMPMPPPGSIPSNGHAFRPRLGPDPRGPPPPLFRPHPPHHFPPMLPPPGVRGPMVPRPHFPPDMRFPGPRDHGYPPAHLPPGGMSVHHSDSFAQGPPEGHQNALGHHTVIGQGQDLAMKANATPQDSDRSAMAEP